MIGEPYESNDISGIADGLLIAGFDEWGRYYRIADR